MRMIRVLERQRRLEARQEHSGDLGDQRHRSIDAEFAGHEQRITSLEERVAALEELVAKTFGKAK